MDRDAKLRSAFRGRRGQSGVQPVLLPPQSPNLKSRLQRFHRSLKEECLSRPIFFGERSLRTAVRQYVGHHYRRERSDQGVENRILDAHKSSSIGWPWGKIGIGRPAELTNA
jgi:putative transposase